MAREIDPMWTDPVEARALDDAPAAEATAGPRVPPARPAILLGYGDFGQTLLRRFLTSAALRGALAWETPPGGASPAERYLRDLAPIWVADPLRSPGGGGGIDRQEPARLEVLRDLLDQIREVQAGGAQPEAVAAEAETAVESLLAAPVQDRRGGRPGLDVFVLARPRTARDLGALERLMRPLMDRVENHRYLRQARRTSYVAILDFANYWDLSAGGRGLREALRRSVERWQGRRREGRPAFDRFYLVDGRTDAGARPEGQRIDEIILFLELMLFEGQRGELQRLFQAHVARESPVYAFGVRVMERRTALLSKRAAAEFGHGWLGYLAGEGDDSQDPEAASLRACLEPCGPQALRRALSAGELRSDLGRTLDRLERELVARLPRPGGDWRETVEVRYRQTEAELWQRLTGELGRRMDDLLRDRLSRLAADLEAAIDADLHHPERPVPLGTVLAEVDRSLAELAALGPAPRRAEPGTDALWRPLVEVDGSYRRFLSDRLNVEKLRRWWWGPMAVAMAVGLAPLLSGLLHDLPQPDPLGPRLLAATWQAAQWLADPVAMSLGLVGLTWGIGALWLQRRFRRRIERAERFFQDPEQGRLADRLRRVLGPGGELRSALEERLERRIQDLVLTARSAVHRELGRVRDRLRERRREMVWLRRQLEEFVRVQGGGGGAGGSEIRVPVEGPEEYERMLGFKRPGPDRYRSTHRELSPFRGWNQPWSDAFLYPLSFIEGLSKLYRDPFEQELSRPGEGPEQERWADAFEGFVQRHGTSPLAFHWPRQEGLPAEERFCLLPPLWRRLRNVREALSDIAVDEQHRLVSRDAGRSYLLRLQGGVDPACLVEAETATARPAAEHPAGRSRAGGSEGGP